MSALDDFAARIESTDVMKQALRSLREEPARLLRDICREHGKAGQPVPYHRLQLIGYLGDTSLRALLAAGLVKQLPGDRTALYMYEPTKEGQEHYEKLQAEGFYKK